MPRPDRPMRLRRTSALRGLVRETRLSPADLVLPLFVKDGDGLRDEITSMPGVYQLSVDEAVREAARAGRLGVSGVLLFGIPQHKDAEGSAATADDEAVQRAVRAIKAEVPDLAVVTDVCLCEYTDHGHCGFLGTDGALELESSLPQHVAAAVSHARAGADLVAPSSMIDGVVGAIRDGLDAAGFGHVGIFSYAVKYASAFYGPFRDAADSAPVFGDRRGHQMDPANAREALREAALDVDEGADLLMVKPALSYLDVIWRVREAFPDRPLGAYHVSGEYAMLKAAAERGWIDERRAALEALTSIKRAGADIVITYYATEAAEWLSEGGPKG
ncbi:porphobilinogen synthase [Rubrivirga sp. S365]|uniref:Delta-aminolevulinic acid dehydratase n=1 Tax=Rubrivirga litoralis TaxID=3075598 RepID=A0ABU3BU67_9BACT|nr:MULTISPECIES: porphobilinogen synthase [unclassified Rubrivirga]MDT0632706.1 porphobilinogen synthase [Rubrivirga sp. F394]MDT7857828.1 porphobilinogen synthase [Rubrivirga sp. S365]